MEIVGKDKFTKLYFNFRRISRLRFAASSRRDNGFLQTLFPTKIILFQVISTMAVQVIYCDIYSANEHINPLSSGACR